jgi:branched-chain amino acid transport system ATP-binding protein
MSEPMLEVKDLVAGYGASTVLDGLDFSMGVEVVAMLGRNGMGKTTLCNVIMGLIPAQEGQIRFQGADITGLTPEKIARAGIAYVPQGRRLFPSLTVDEHLRMLSKATQGKRWTPSTVLELFPRLAERRGSSAATLSGGEQQMLSIGRALLLNSPLLLMDEPSEGLAPKIVNDLISITHTLVSEGVAVLVVEQNIGAATRMAERQLMMVNGSIAAELTADELLADHDAQRRYLGVDA